MYAQALSETDLEYSTLTKAKWVSSQIEICRRRQSLTHAHHSEVASLEPKEQDKWLDRAESEGLTVKELRQEIRDAKRKNRVAIWPRPGQAKVAVLACSIYTQRSAPPPASLYGGRTVRPQAPVVCLAIMVGRAYTQSRKGNP